MNDKYLIRDMHAGFLGNSPIFWKQNNSGYTQWIDEARLFTSIEADELIEGNPSRWQKYRAEKVFSISKRTMDIQDWNKQAPTGVK